MLSRKLWISFCLIMKKKKKNKMSRALLLLLIFFTVAAAGPVQYDWSGVDDVLTSGISQKIYPGGVALVADSTGVLFTSAVGAFTYSANPPAHEIVTVDTLYDLASLTKVLASTTALMLLHQLGHVDLDMRISDPLLLGEEFAANGKAPITVKHLLLHNSGLPAGPSPTFCEVFFRFLLYSFKKNEYCSCSL